MTEKLVSMLGEGKESQAKRDDGEAAYDLDSLTQQLVVTQAEWMRQQGRTPTGQDVERLQRTAHDRRSTLARITQLVMVES